jgi:hypothetical protein
MLSIPPLAAPLNSDQCGCARRPAGFLLLLHPAVTRSAQPRFPGVARDHSWPGEERAAPEVAQVEPGAGSSRDCEAPGEAGAWTKPERYAAYEITRFKEDAQKIYDELNGKRYK